MKKIQVKPENTINLKIDTKEILPPYEIIYADPRDEEIHLNFLKRTQINAHMARWFLDYEYNQLIWSDGVFEILELDTRKFGANYNTFLEAIHPDDRHIKSQAQKDLQTTAKPIEINYRLLFNDGRIKWLNEICSTDFDSENQPIRSYGTIQDISKYKFTEDNFRKKEEQFRNLIESIPSGIAIVQGNKFVFINSAGRKLFAGHSTSNLLGKNISTVITPLVKNSFLKKIKTAANGNAAITFENKMKRLDETIFDAEITLTKTSFLGLPATQLAVNDITKRIETENKLKENESRLSELLATKDKFISIIAHDLRNPLNSIIGFIKLLRNQYEDFTVTERNDQLNLIEDNAVTTLALLNDLLDWAKAQKGLMLFQPTSQKLLPIINKVEEILTLGLKQKQLSLIYSSAIDFEVFADRNMLLTILLNLTGNAVKYSFNGGRITINAAIKNNLVEISVIDTGTGIPEDTRSKLFNPDKQDSVQGTLDEKGSGLGLMLCKDLIEKHNGQIWVKSKPGRGSKFIFSIPLKSN